MAGIGQGGPSHNPHTAGHTRPGSDAGQPGGSQAFTIRVTPDMCAEIAACSGRLSKRRPVYIWDAPIDDWARAAVDVASDFVPGVSQAKAVYDAYQRISSGENPADVLMSAGADGLLGLIPGAKAGKKLGKALGKAGDVADAAGDVQRAAKATPKALEPAMKRQKQMEHVTGTKEHARRVSGGGSPSTFSGGADEAVQRTREAYRRGQAVPGRPNVREHDFGTPVGLSNGNSTSRVRVHEDGAGRIHGHPY